MAPLVEQLQQVLDWSLLQLFDLGELGESLVGSRFTKQAVGTRFISIY